MSASLLNALRELTDYLKSIEGQVLRAQGSNNERVWTETLKLNTETTKNDPLHVHAHDFKSIAFQNATDDECFVWVIFDRVNAGKKAVKFKNNSSLSTDMQFSECTIYAPDQGNKSIDVFIFKDSEYSSGSLINSGSISQRPPASVQDVVEVELEVGLNVAAIPANANRKKCHVRNATDGFLTMGGENIDDTAYVDRAEAGDKFTHDNTGALSIYAESAGSIYYYDEE